MTTAAAWPEVRLGDVVQPVRKVNPAQSGVDHFTYIDLGSVDQLEKRIDCPSVLAVADAPTRARQLVASGDVLVSTVRPNLNAIAQVTVDLDGATASTGFAVLRPDPGRIDSRFLVQWVRHPVFIDRMVRLATGASYPAVTDRAVKESMIPLPPIEEQRRIAAVLDQADELRAKRRAALALLDTLTESIFLDMFGDPVTNPKGWPLVPLRDLGALDRGVSRHRPRNDPALLGGPYPFVQTGDVARSGGYIEEWNATYSELGYQQSRVWPAGTLCVTIAANIARTGILTFDACFPDSVVGFVAPDAATVEYVRVTLGFFQASLEKAAPESAQKNINLAVLRGLLVPNVPEDLILRFAFSVARVKALADLHRIGLAELDALFASLQHRAFRGEL